MDMKTKIINGVIASAAAFVVTGAINKGWQMVTGHEPPREEEEGNLAGLVLFAGASAMAVALTQRLIYTQLKKRLD